LTPASGATALGSVMNKSSALNCPTSSFFTLLFRFQVVHNRPSCNAQVESRR
jgi:hypothetical protein